MIAWPHKGRLPSFSDAEPVIGPLGAVYGEASAVAPAVDPMTPGKADQDNDTPQVEMPPASVVAAVIPRRMRRRWLVPAGLVSVTAHAAAIFALVSWLDLRNVEADIDEVSIEIVVEPPDAAGVAADQTESEMAEETAIDPPGFVPPDPFAPQLSRAPDFSEPIQPVTILPDVPMPAALASPPPMPPVQSFELPMPGALAVLAAPPKFDLAGPVAEPPAATIKPPKAQQPKPAKPQSGAKAEPKPEPRRKQVDVERKPAKKQVETRKTEAQARQSRKAASDEPSQKKRAAANGGGNPAAGLAGKGSGATDRKQGETGKIASAASGGAAQYGAQVNRHVQRFRRYPVEAERAGIKGVVRVSIRIDSSGRLSGASVRAGSGHAVLDREALATVKRASPYPKPPAGVAPASFSLTLRFSR